MTMAEFRAWQEFYSMLPFDDLHRHYRPAALVSASLAGGKLDERLEWLAPRMCDAPAGGASVERTQADLDLFRAAGVKIK